jgi:VanZ family protein
MSVDDQCAVIKVLFFAALLAISYLALAPNPEQTLDTGWDKANHLLAFFCLAALLDAAFSKWSLVLKLGLLFSYGLLIEASQGLMPLREASWLDIMANSIGLALYIPLQSYCHRLKQWFFKPFS